ncbi:MAG: NAD(P)-dependent glycerol-3-phosphate dehydrogenase [Eubacterium sp.]|nr:NAD(P)-dependent glycerol-3-phosphate dehydrogenase [Eubacterium sp.]MBQ6363923.1 NAD(P)-dependent glycerol-3-phosphate dehydrogenase [Lachnospiraceae bacterium]
MAEIGVIGAGSWGTALSAHLGRCGHDVKVWSIDPAEVDMLNQEHEQKVKLPGVILPENVSASGDLSEVMQGRGILVLVVPSPFVRSTAARMAPFYEEGQLIVSAAKGIEENTLLTLSEIIQQEISGARVSVLCGPTHAEEVGMGLPTAIVAGAATQEEARLVQDTFMSPEFRVYTSPDLLGMQIGAALKNVIALAAGVADGLGYGDNTKAALITRGIAEMTRLGCAMGGRAETFAGLTGIGDLIVTCASMHSRNRRAGILIGQGKTADEAMREVQQVVEGVYSARAAKQLAAKYQVEVPIIDQVCAVLFEGKDPAEAVRDLMIRDKKVEINSLDWSR